MSSRKQITVTRDYSPAPDQCARALALLLKKPVSNEAAGLRQADDLKDAMKGSKHDRATPNHSR